MLDKEAIISRTVKCCGSTSSGVYQRLGMDARAHEIWEKYATGNSRRQLLALSLSNDGVSLEDVASEIRVTDLNEALKRNENRWLSELDEIVQRYHSTSVTECMLQQKQSVTELCLQPFVDWLMQTLQPALERFSKVITPPARAQLVNLVWGRLAFCAEDTLLTCARYFENARDVPYWRKVPVSGNGKKFLVWFYEQGIELLANTYPVLAEKLLLLLETHRKNCIAFLESFEKDISELAAAFALPEERIVIASLTGNLSDAHNEGKSVLKLELCAGKSIFYKPRSMAVDCAWNAFADQLMRNGFPTRLHTPVVLDRQTYGYAEEITARSRLDDAGIREYYRNAGGLCCVVSLLGGSDFHHENIIAQGAVPVLIDVETIMTPKPAPMYGLAEVNKSEGASTHVGRTLMLQQWVGNSIVSSRDIGGFTSEQDDMQNIPVAPDGSRKGAEYFAREFSAGFADAYDFFLKHRQRILREKWLDVFAPCRFRYVFRRTALYYSLIRHFYSAPFLRDIKYFEAALSRLGAGVLLNFDREDAKRLWELVVTEKEAVRLADIPYFTCHGNSRDLSSVDRLCVVNFFETAPIALAQKNLLGMSDEGKTKELAYIQLDLETCRVQKSFGAGTPLLSYQEVVRHPYPEEFDEQAVLLPEVDRLMAIIDSFELEKGSFEYYAPVRNQKTTRYNLEVLPGSIYSGTLGVLLAQGAYARQKGDDSLRSAVINKMQVLYTDEFHTGRGSASLNIGFSQGVSGYLQTAMLLSDILQEEHLLDMALRVALDVPEEHVSRASEFDFFGGLAGALYYHSKLCQRMPHPKLRARIRLLLQELLGRAMPYKQWQTVWRSEREYQPLTGLAHGQCGIAVALLEARKIVDDPDLAKMAQQLFGYEDSCYSPAENNWFDFRKFDVALREYSPGDSYRPRFMHGYCSGAPGIGISRIVAARQLGVADFDADIRKAVDFCRSPQIIGNDSLCCGSGSWVDLLIEASLYTDRTEFRDCAKRICNGIVPKVSGKEYLLSNLNGTSDISLFKGYGGIVYQMLRVIDPICFPSVMI